jgi:hypothetical protein
MFSENKKSRVDSPWLCPKTEIYLPSTNQKKQFSCHYHSQEATQNPKATGIIIGIKVNDFSSLM